MLRSDTWCTDHTDFRQAYAFKLDFRQLYHFNDEANFDSRQT